MTEAKVGKHALRVTYRPGAVGADWACETCATGGGGPKLDVERAVYRHLGIEYDSRVNLAVAKARDEAAPARTESPNA